MNSRQTESQMRLRSLRGIVIAVDFDGTVVTHDYPEVGSDVPHAVDVLKALVKKGAKIILYTMRSGLHLRRAEAWYKLHNIKLYASQRNPTQDRWTDSPKCYANIFIDDAALGCPLIETDGRSVVDWLKVAEYFDLEV